MDPFVRQLNQLAASERTRAKWVFVPYVGLGWTLGERLLHSGRSWANFRFVTPFDLALEAVAPSLLARGLNPKPEDLGPSLAHRLLSELRGPVRSCFRPLLDQPGMAEALWKTLRQVRMAGLSADQVAAAVRGARKAELGGLFRAYEAYLERHRLADRAQVLREAVEAGARTPVQPDHLVLEFPSTAWSPLERRFLDLLPGRRVKARCYDLPLPRRWALLCPHREAAASEESCDVDLLRRVRAPDRLGAVDGTLRFFRAGRRDAEVLEALRRIRELPLDQVEMALADPEAQPLLRDKLALLGLPATFERGTPVADSRPGQALLGVLAWVEHRYAAFDLRELLLSGLLSPRDRILPAAYLLERSQATWGRDTYQVALGAMQARLLSDLASDGNGTRRDQAAQVGHLAEWIAGLLKRLPVDGQDRADWACWVRGLRGILQDEVVAESPRDQAAVKRITRALDEFLMLEGQRWSVEETVRLLRERLAGLTFAASRALPGHLHVTSLARVGLTGRPHVFVLGLEEGRLGGGEVEDPILKDDERARLHEGLARSADLPEEALFTVLERLACLEGRVTLSYSTRDLRSGQELLPGWLLFQAARLLKPLKSYRELEEWLGEPAGCAPAAPDESAGEADWWLSRLPAAGESGLEVVQARFPHLARGHQALEARESEQFTAFDGLVASAAGRLDPRGTGEAVSASGLQTLAGCPFRFFLEYGLKLKPLGLQRPDPDGWLDASTRGRLLHAVYAAYHRELRARGWTPDPGRDRKRLFDLLERQLDELRAQVPPPSQAVARQERSALRRDLEKFLRLEVAEPERRPVGFEVGFGMPDLEDEPLARSEPVVVDLGEGMKLPLRGRIDRIDQLPEGLEVVDYKTGFALGTARGGRLLQHALYALVAEQLVGHLGPVLGASYYFPTTMAREPRLAHPFPDRSGLRRLLLDLLEPLETGAFVHSESESDCKYCEVGAACRAGAVEAARRKLENPDNQQLGFRRRLKEAR